MAYKHNSWFSAFFWVCFSLILQTSFSTPPHPESQLKPLRDSLAPETPPTVKPSQANQESGTSKISSSDSVPQAVSILPSSKFLESSCWSLGQIKYRGGGNWYTHPQGLENLVSRLRQDLGPEICERPVILDLLSPQLYRFPFLYISGQSSLPLRDTEYRALRKHLLAGGLLLVDDNSPPNKNFRTTIKKIFPKINLKKIEPGHPLYTSLYKLPSPSTLFKHKQTKIKAPSSSSNPKTVKIPVPHHNPEGLKLAPNIQPEFWILADGNRGLIIYTYNANLNAQWAQAPNPTSLTQSKQKTHNNDAEYFLKWGVNTLAWYLQGAPSQLPPSTSTPP